MFAVLITIHLESSCLTLMVFIYFMRHDHWLSDLVDSHLSSNLSPAVSSVFVHLAKELTSLRHGQAPSSIYSKFTTPVISHYPSFSAGQIPVKLAHSDNLMGFHLNPAQGQCQMISFWHK